MKKLAFGRLQTVHHLKSIWLCVFHLSYRGLAPSLRLKVASCKRKERSDIHDALVAIDALIVTPVATACLDPRGVRI